MRTQRLHEGEEERVTMFLTFAPFLARAGGGIGGGGGGHSSSSGGSHFSSGGSHTFVGGGGFSSGGGSGGGGFGVLFILVPIIVLVLIFVIVGHRRSKHPATAPGWLASNDQGWPSPGSPTMGPTPTRHVAQTDAVASGLAAVHAHDPGFDEDAFLATAERCFFAVEEAWSQQRPELSQPVMAEEAWQRQKTEMGSYRSAGRRNVLENLTVAKATILAAESEDGRDQVTVRFRAASANYDIDAASGRVVRGNHQMAFWEQDWVFQRSSQATTDGGSGQGQRCPNCGAPLDVDIAGVCKNCKASVSGGDANWMVLRAGQA
jgi:predicted lipid-binding transport protein (Tim44 family)